MEVDLEGSHMVSDFDNIYCMPQLLDVSKSYVSIGCQLFA